MHSIERPRLYSFYNARGPRACYFVRRFELLQEGVGLIDRRGGIFEVYPLPDRRDHRCNGAVGLARGVGSDP